jgi:hypothetical protein
MTSPIHVLTDRERSTALDVKIEVLKVEVQTLKEAVSASINETRHWRDEMKTDSGQLALSFATRFEKHETQDEHRHASLEGGILRLENETIAGAKMAIGRIEELERKQVAASAVDVYKRWLIATILVSGGALLLNALNVLRILNASPLIPK